MDRGGKRGDGDLGYGLGVCLEVWVGGREGGKGGWEGLVM